MIGNCSNSPYTFKINTLIERVIFAYFLDWKSSRHNIFSPLRQTLNGTVGEELFWTWKVRFVFASDIFQEALLGFL